jgi:prepilin-type N-terminal cleavage/methylation domain-containing protein
MNTSKRSRQAGFTVIELIVVAVIVALAAVLVFVQINNLRIANQDNTRKQAINAMYYGLEEVYYKQHHSYPQTLTSSTLPSVDPSLFTDPDGFTLGTQVLSQSELQNLINNGKASSDVQARLASLSAGKSPNYHYNPTNCDTSGNCKSYTLSADLVGEAKYVKNSRHTD